MQDLNYNLSKNSFHNLHLNLIVFVVFTSSLLRNNNRPRLIWTLFLSTFEQAVILISVTIRTTLKRFLSAQFVKMFLPHNLSYVDTYTQSTLDLACRLHPEKLQLA